MPGPVPVAFVYHVLMNLFLYRLFGAAMLDAGMYEGLEADRRTTPQAFAAYIKSETIKYARVIKQVGIKPE